MKKLGPGTVRNKTGGIWALRGRLPGNGVKNWGTVRKKLAGCFLQNIPESIETGINLSVNRFA